MISVTEARQLIMAGITPLEIETVGLEKARGRLLRQPVIAPFDLPPFAASAMDGYACKSSDITTLPISLKQVGVSSAGHPFRQPLKVGETVRVFTGSVLPEGADLIALQEKSISQGSQVTISEVPPVGRYIRPAGYDCPAETELVKAGTRLQSRHLGLAASAGYKALPVSKRPLVAFLSSGNELQEPGCDLKWGQIFASNGTTLSALIESWGALPLSLGLIPDSETAFLDAISEARERAPDCLICLGGASVGDFDLTRPSLEKAGMTLDFHKIAMRPGKPLLCGHFGSMPVLGIPGNPVSSFVCAHLFLKPLLQLMQGDTAESDYCSARLGLDLPANDEREDYLRCRLERKGADSLYAYPFMTQDSSQFFTLSQADALLVRPPFAPAALAGEVCQVLPLYEGRA